MLRFDLLDVKEFKILLKLVKFNIQIY